MQIHTLIATLASRRDTDHGLASLLGSSDPSCLYSGGFLLLTSNKCSSQTAGEQKNGHDGSNGNPAATVGRPFFLSTRGQAHPVGNR